MIGLALVTLVATLAGSVVQTFTGAVNEIFVGDYAITAQNNFSPIPIDAAEAAAQAPGVQAIGNVRTRRDARLRLDRVLDRRSIRARRKVIKLDWVEGSDDVFDELGKDGAFVDKDFAEKHNLQVGSPIGDHLRERQHRDLHGQGDLRPAVRWIAVRRRHDLDRGLGRPELATRRTSTRSCSWRAARRTRTRRRSRQR